MSEPIPNQPPTTPPTFEPDPTKTTKGYSRRRLALLTLAAVTSVAAVGAAVPSIVSASRTGQASSNPGSGHSLQTDQKLDLSDIELGELADELESLGLELTITPTPLQRIESELDESDTASAGSDEDQEPSDADQVDPFEGMTDEEIDALSDEEFFDLLDQAGVGTIEDGDLEDGGWDQSQSEDESSSASNDSEIPLASFTVNNGSLATSSASPEQSAQAQAIWNRFAEIIPAAERPMVSAFELMAEEYGGAHVYADEDDPTKWILGVGLGMEGDELDYVLIHEFGHLLTLKASEVPPGDNGSCPTYDPGEGCALSQSTLAEFVAAFWPESQRDELERLNESGDWDALDAFYAANADSFVSDYATTNPVEDLAETFTEFVLKDRPQGSTIADQKVRMLWSDQVMVSLRSEIRSRL